MLRTATLLVCDIFANRIYLPSSIVLVYPVFAYSIALLMQLIRKDIEKLAGLPELKYFDVERNDLAWGLPLAIAVAVYLAQRVKFWWLDEGDQVFNFHLWAKQANERIQYIEQEGIREEESF